MPPAAPGDRFIILFDTRAGNRSEALQTLIKLNYIHILAPCNNKCKIILTNVNDTNNIKGFKNIYVLDNNSEMGSKALLDSIDTFSPGDSCWMEALEVGIEYLKTELGNPGVVTLQLLFITDFTNSRSKGIIEKNICSVINDLNKCEIYLYIIGPSVDPPHMIMSVTHLEKWISNLTIQKTSDENLSLVKRIVDNTKHTVVANFKLGIHLFTSYKNSKGSQPWMVPLSFGKKLLLPVRTSRVTKEVPFKLVAEGRAYDVGKWVVADDEETVVDISQCISGVIRHGKFIRINNEAMFKCSAERTFGVLGFTDSSNVHEYLMTGDATYFVLPDPYKSEYHAEIMIYLIRKLAELKKYVVVRRVYNKDNTPKFFVLMPESNVNPTCFLMVELPYADDIRFNYVEMTPGNAKKIEPVEELVNFLDCINIHKNNGKVMMPLGPCMMYDPNCMMLINKVEEKFSENPLPLANIDLDLKDVITREDTKMDKLKSLWPTRKIVKVSKEEENIKQDEFDDYAEIFDF